MRIGIFTNCYPPSRGGMEVSVINLCRGLKELGHQVFVFTASTSGFQDSLKDNVFRCKAIHLYYKGIDFYCPVVPFSDFKSSVKSLKLDIVHTHQPVLMGQEGFRYAQTHKIPAVTTHHIRYSDYLFYSLYVPKIFEKIYSYSIKKIIIERISKYDRIIVPSKSIKDSLLPYKIKKRIDVIPNGIDIERFSNISGRDEIRKTYGINDNSILLLLVSRLTPQKNIEFLLRSFAKITSFLPNVYFMIVGGGEQDDLEKLAKSLGIYKKITFAGSQPPEKIPRYYQAADIFIFSSLSETQGLVMVEAMAAGLPVVAIKASGVQEVVKNNKSGILTDNSLKKFTQAIERLIRDVDLRKKMSICAKQEAQKYSIEETTKKFEKMYREVLGTKNNLR